MESKTRRIAGISLFVMGAGFAASLPFQEHTAARLMAGAFEAGLVGGLADWFAVTALFRHPLGIPIPHTALLPRNREKMTQALVTLVQNNLLNKESIVDKLKELEVAERLMQAIRSGISSSRFKGFVKERTVELLSKPVDKLWAALLPHISGYVRTRDWAGMLLSLAGDEKKVRPAVESVLNFAVDKGTHWVVTDDARRMMGGLAIRAIGGLKMNGLMQFAVNAALNYFDEDQIGGAIQVALVTKLRELRLDGHPTREAVLAYLEKEWETQSTSPENREKWNAKLQDLLGEWVEGDKPLALLEELRDKLRHRIEAEELLEKQVYPFLEETAEKLSRNERLLTAINSFVQDMTVRFLETNHSRIGSLVRENVEKMDNDTLIALVEEKAGKDLQWIRVNGAVCGFFLGLVFTSVRMLLA